MQLGEPGYDELWAFADLRGSEYASLRVTPTETEDAWVSGLVIAHQRHKDGSHGSFLLVELDEDANVIGDWFEADLDEAKEHGAVLADRESTSSGPIRRTRQPAL
jgi:hypothetical protein